MENQNPAAQILGIVKGIAENHAVAANALEEIGYCLREQADSIRETGKPRQGLLSFFDGHVENSLRQAQRLRTRVGTAMHQAEVQISSMFSDMDCDSVSGPEDAAAVVRAALKSHGPAWTAATIGISIPTAHKVAAGSDVSNRTAALVQNALEKLMVG